MSQAELAAWLESRDAHWCAQYQAAPAPAPDEESEIVAQFLTAPYPYQNDAVGQEHQNGHHELGVISATTSATYWPEPCHVTEPGATVHTSNSSASGGTGAYFDSSGGCLYYYDLADPSPQPKRKVRAGRDGEDLGRHKKKGRASDNKAASKTAQKCRQESSQQSRASCSGDDSNCTDVNRCSEAHGGGGGGNAKVRAAKGSATDPQSLYARRRRERINERLKILQKLVPNGTKVDISTMLEEAARYVRFLQEQIKMLSSDEMWMYAPIAYNGMSLGIDSKISPR